MICESCRAEIDAESTVCPECGELVVCNIEGFKSTKDILRQLKAMISNHGRRIITEDSRFVALLNDYIPEYDKERGLLRNMIESGLIRDMMKESNHDMAVLNAKNFMLGKMFLSESASEFVVVCFTYMLGWEYLSPLREKDEAQIEEEKKKKKFTPINIEAMVFFPIDAAKYRLALNVNIAEGYTKIEGFSFDGFGLLRTVRLPSTMLAIGEYAFSECKHLKTINLPPSLKVIRQGAFCQCAKLTVINIPKGVLEIEDSTFSFCQNLEVIEIPDTVGSIGALAFSGCEKLRKLFLPDSVKYIENDAFSGCPGLTIHCYENSYVHKFCLTNGIRFETVSEGKALREKKGINA